MTEEKEAITPDEEFLGRVTIDDEVIASIAQNITLDQSGVAQMFSGLTDKVLGKWTAVKGVKIEHDEEGKLHITLSLSVYYGHRIPDVASEVQCAVRDGIEEMIDIPVGKVDVHVQSLVFNQENNIEGEK